MKKYFILIAVLSSIFALHAKVKIAVLDFKQIDRKADYVTKKMMKDDFKDLLKNNNDAELIDMKTSTALVKDKDVLALSIAELKEIGATLKADVLIWGSVNVVSNTEFSVKANLFDATTDNVQDASFTVVKNNEERQKAINENLIKKAIIFAEQAITVKMNIAKQYYVSRNYAEAETAFLELANLLPDNLEVISYLSFIYIAQRKYPQAIELTSSAIEKFPTEENLYSYLALAQKNTGQYESSIATYKQLNTFAPKVKYWLEIGDMYLEELHYTEEAMTAYKSALALEPQNTEVQKKIGLVYYDQQNYAAAIPYLETAANAYPDDETLAKDLGISYLKTGNMDSAIKNYLDIIAKDGSNSKAYMNLANAYSATEQYGKALETLQNLAKVTPEDANVYLKMADIYISIKKYEQAETSANTAIKLTPASYKPYPLLAQIAYIKGYAAYEEFLKLDERARTEKIYGQEKDTLISQRDKARQKSNALFSEADAKLNQGLGKEPANEAAQKDIDGKRKLWRLKDLLDATKSTFFDKQ